MKSTGFIKKIDGLGRIVIPKSVRKTLGVEHYDNLQFFVEGDSVVLKKYGTSCIFCGSENDTITFHEKCVCKYCIKELKND